MEIYREFKHHNKRYPICVCEKGVDWGVPGKVLKVVNRVLIGKCIGNFNPLFCTYMNKECLVMSRAGDLSDPFRREQSYETTLYIELE